MNHTEAELRKFKYLTQPQIAEIMETFRLLGLSEFEPYQGSYDFTKQIEQASNLQSCGIEYTVSTSTSDKR